MGFKSLWKQLPQVRLEKERQIRSTRWAERYRWGGEDQADIDSNSDLKHVKKKMMPA